MTTKKNIISDRLYGHFLIGLSRSGAYLENDFDLQHQIRGFLNRGIENIDEDIDSNPQVDHAIQQAERLGEKVAKRSKVLNEGIITNSIWGSIVSYICPFTPFC